ncbi:MAG: ATP-binding cassette domain-containing protein [Lachnospiraceae bacterium]|nr:ATP-binding cassette domain-containing protein [Lachnospiraceae bacterium]
MAFEVKKLNKAFGIGGARRRVVRNFTMKVQDNEMVAIVGKKGSGKSTLMSMLSGMLRPDSGTITIDGRKIYYWNPFQMAMIRSKRVGVVPRDALLIPDMTVYENLLVPMGHKFMTSKRKMRRAKEVLRAVGLKGFGKYYPADLEDFEIQKVCLARAIMTNPKYLILDEPTGNLQSADVDRFMEIVEILRSSGFTIIVLTHSRRVASHCERLIPIAQPRTSLRDEEESEEEEEKPRRKSGVPAETAVTPTVSATSEYETVSDEDEDTDSAEDDGYVPSEDEEGYDESEGADDEAEYAESDDDDEAEYADDADEDDDDEADEDYSRQ